MGAAKTMEVVERASKIVAHPRPALFSLEFEQTIDGEIR
jgi:hypothetical protein